MESPRTIVRNAAFRNIYASAQTAFVIQPDNVFAVVTPTPLLTSDALIYAILIHGPVEYGFGKDGRFVPGFIQIVFLDRECSNYLDRIDLVARFGKMSASSTTAPTVIEDRANPEIISRPDGAPVDAPSPEGSQDDQP